MASYDKHYVVLMMVTQAGTGSGTSGPAVRKIWEALYGVNGMKVNTARRAPPGARPPAGLPVFAKRRRDPAADGRADAGEERDDRRRRPPTAPRPQRQALAGTTTRVKRPRLDWVLMLAAGALLAVGALLVWSATVDARRPDRRRPDSVLQEARW